MAVVVSAVATAIELGTLAAALTAVATVGTAMTVVGVVTHSKELTKIGGIMALVGGAGGLVNGALTATAGAAAGAGAAEGAAAASAAGSAEAGWAGMAGDAVAGINSAGLAPIAFDGASAAASGAASAAPGLAASNSLTSFLGTPASSASGVSGLVPDASGSIATDVSSPFTNEYGLPSGGATDKALGVTGPMGIQDLATPADGGLMAQMKSKLGAAWDDLGPTGKAEMLKSVLAMPGGIQNQNNIESQLAIQQQKANQTSYGSAVPTFGIINKAKG